MNSRYLFDEASLANSRQLSPGAIVTLFGSTMGPSQGVGFELPDQH
jgi:hypothetical protein